MNWRSVYVGKYKQDKRWLNPFSEKEVEEGGHVQFAHDNNPRQLLFVDSKTNTNLILLILTVAYSERLCLSLV